MSQARFLHAITLSVSQGVDATLKGSLSLLYLNMLGFWPRKNTNKLGRRGHSFVVQAGVCVSSSVLPAQRVADPSPISSGLWATSRVEQFQEERLKGHCREVAERTHLLRYFLESQRCNELALSKFKNVGDNPQAVTDVTPTTGHPEMSRDLRAKSISAHFWLLGWRWLAPSPVVLEQNLNRPLFKIGLYSPFPSPFSHRCF